MSIKITFKKNISNKLIKNYVLFSNDDFKINALNSLPIEKNTAAINRRQKGVLKKTNAPSHTPYFFCNCIAKDM